MPANLRIESVQVIGNPQLDALWEVVFTKQPAALAAPLQGLTLRATALTPPGSTLNTVDRWFQGQAYVVPGRVQYHGTIQITFEENEDGTILSIFDEWRQVIRDVRTGVMATPAIADVKAEMRISSLKRTGDYNNANYLVSGVMLTVIDTPQHKYDGNAILHRQMTFSFDSWILGSQGQVGEGIALPG